MLKNQKGFTLIELIIIIVIIGILAAVAIPRYIDMTSYASDATAKGVLGALRGANGLVFAQRVIALTNGPYTMVDVVNSAQIQGVTTGTPATDSFTIVVSSRTYTFNFTAGNVPTAMGTVYNSSGW